MKGVRVELVEGAQGDPTGLRHPVRTPPHRGQTLAQIYGGCRKKITRGGAMSRDPNNTSNSRGWFDDSACCWLCFGYRGRGKNYCEFLVYVLVAINLNF